ncbi:MAG: N-acetylmuramic acid 6-phosphate etherase [Pyrinomonadaceae bacterium]|nr:N-acetylmuramic acid 6-phosphate etherase [Pyrinomonadaceae bacterium]
MAISPTEQENPNTAEIDSVSTLDAIRLINDEDKGVAGAVEKALPAIAEVIEEVAKSLKSGGHLFYIGTGTSGRLGVLDASEIPPTFGVSAEMIQGVIAGGYDALHKAVEASEDDKHAGASDLQGRGLSKTDVVIGIAASGRTPFTIGAVEFARSIGCFTACITCNPDSPITSAVVVPIVALVGPEAITGSTRMKAGTAQKMILNMISTVTMIKLGYVKGNRMTNLKPKNAKLIERSIRILQGELDVDENSAKNLFSKAKNDLRIALVIGKTGVGYEESSNALEKTNFAVEKAVRILRATS